MGPVSEREFTVKDRHTSTFWSIAAGRNTKRSLYAFRLRWPKSHILGRDDLGLVRACALSRTGGGNRVQPHSVGLLPGGLSASVRARALRVRRRRARGMQRSRAPCRLCGTSGPRASRCVSVHGGVGGHCRTWHVRVVQQVNCQQRPPWQGETPRVSLAATEQATPSGTGGAQPAHTPQPPPTPSAASERLEMPRPCAHSLHCMRLVCRRMLRDTPATPARGPSHLQTHGPAICVACCALRPDPGEALSHAAPLDHTLTACAAGWARSRICCGPACALPGVAAARHLAGARAQVGQLQTRERRGRARPPTVPDMQHPCRKWVSSPALRVMHDVTGSASSSARGATACRRGDRCIRRQRALKARAGRSWCRRSCGLRPAPPSMCGPVPSAWGQRSAPAMSMALLHCLRVCSNASCCQGCKHAGPCLS